MTHRMTLLPALLLLTVAARAQRDAPVDALRDDIVPLFESVVAHANASIVEVHADGARVARGTVVRSGVIVTKASELPADAELQCVLPDGRTIVATRSGSDARNDLEILTIDALDLPAIEWADAIPSPGAWLASADGAGAPTAVGILSAPPYEHARAYLGVRMARDEGPPRLDHVVGESAAADAGLRAGDVILRADGEPLTASQDLGRVIRARAPGEELRLEIRRGDAVLSVVATLRHNTSGDRSSQERIWGELSDVRAGFGTVLQHDAILEPRDCGGPVVGLDGRAIGINIARAGRIETLALPRPVVEAAVAEITAGTGRGEAR